MSPAESQELADVWQRVTAWPDQLKRSLVSRLLQSISGESALSDSNPTRGPAIEDMVGLAATSNAAPDDNQVRQWLVEKRQEKYGT